MSRKTALVIGGTGVVGKPVVMELIKHDEYSVHSISLEKGYLPESVTQLVIDRNSKGYVKFVEKLNSEFGPWDVVVDICAFDDKSAEQTHSLFNEYAKHFVILSTALVYDRSKKNEQPISEDTPVAQMGKSGGYVDGKLRLEKFWQNVTDKNWTLLRPYHILGEWSLLGCLPEHNRDPKLLERIKNGEALKLCNGGEISFNYIHPKDIAVAIYKIVGNTKTFGQAYNLVNPKPIAAKNYYEEIARQIGCGLRIENESMSSIWTEMKGWEMTTLPHLYSMEKMKTDIGYIPDSSLEEGIKDAIQNPPVITVPIEQVPIHQRMNKLPRPTGIDWLQNE